MAARRRSSLPRLGGIVLAAGLLAAGLPRPAMAAVGIDTLVASLTGDNLPDDGDPGGSGTFSLALDRSIEQACFVLDVTLTDLAGDPPTAIGVHDSYTGEPGDELLALATGVDGAGHATGCVAAPASLIDSMFADPNRYTIDVQTAGYPGDAVRGWIEYSYEMTNLSVSTRICPASIQSVDQLTESAKADCLVVVLPADDVAGSIPDGYAVNGYGGTATFDYHATDGKHLDATIADASRGGGGTCSDITRSCDLSWLPYDWNRAGMGEIHVVPTLLPGGTRFGSAEAIDATEPGGPISLSIGAGNELTVDATGRTAIAVLVYLFLSPDTTGPTVSRPKVSLRTGATFGSRAPIRVAWTGSDAGSGIDRYAVQRSIDGGPWKTIASSVFDTSYDTSMAGGHSYSYRIRAYDNAGHRRTSDASPSQRFHAVQDTSASVHFAGTWHRASPSGASGGSLHYSTDTGATSSLQFTGRSIAWVAPRSPSRGSAKVYIDGTYVTTVSLNGSPAVRAVVFAKRFAAVATHRIKVRVLGTPGNPRIDVDAFLYLR